MTEETANQTMGDSETGKSDGTKTQDEMLAEEWEKSVPEMEENKQEKEDKNGNGKSEIKSVPDLDFILDIPLKLSVEFGRTKMAIKDLMQLGQGSVIELAKDIGEPLEIYANDKLLAMGEVVVINEKFGIRLTNIVSPKERIEKLK